MHRPPDGVCVLGLQEEEGWKRVLEEHRDPAPHSAEAQMPAQTGHVAAAQEEHQGTALRTIEAELPSQTGDVAAALEGGAQEAAQGASACYHVLHAMQTCFSCQRLWCQHMFGCLDALLCGAWQVRQA